MRTCRRQSKSYNSTIKLEVRGKSCNAVKKKKFNAGLSPEIGVLAGTRSQEGYVYRTGYSGLGGGVGDDFIPRKNMGRGVYSRALIV